MNAIHDISLKFDWAKQYLQSLKDEVAAYVNDEPNTFESKLEQQVGCDAVIAIILRIKLEPPPRVALVLGDFLYNARATLDHLVYYLSVTKTNDPAIVRTSEFPIFKDYKLYEGGLWKIRAVDPKAQKIIENLQPYHCGKGYNFDPLWKLNELCNIDKHRRLHVIQPPIGDGTIWCPGATITRTETFFNGPLVDGTVIARCWVTLPNPGAHVLMKHYLRDDVIVNQLEVLPHWVLETAAQITHRIEDDIIPLLAPFLH